MSKKNKNNILDIVAPLMSITSYAGTIENPQDPNSDVIFHVEWGVKKPLKLSGRATKQAWQSFVKRKQACEDSFWEMGNE
jgi:hypothetical protein